MSRPEAGVVPGTLGRGGQPSLLAEIKTYIFNFCTIPQEMTRPNDSQ